MFKFLHAADVHLDSPLRGLENYEGAPVDEIRGATRRAFENLVSLALEEEVAFVLLAGDLFDGDWKDYNTGLYFVKCMTRLRKAGIPVFMVLGNHDAANQMTKTLRFPENVTLFSSRTPETVFLENYNVSIHGISYLSRVVSKNLASDFPPRDPHSFNIGVLHTCLNGREGHEFYAPCSVDDLVSKGYDYWALGHVHLEEQVCKDPWIVFPGCLQGRHIRESGPKSAALVSVDNGEICAVQQRHVDVLRWRLCRLDLARCQTIDEVFDQARNILQEELDKAEGRTLAIRLILAGKCAIHDELISTREFLAEELRSIAVDLGNIWLEKILFQSQRMVDFNELVGEENPLGELLNMVARVDNTQHDLYEWIPDVAKLKNKLPASFFDVERSLFPDSREQMDEFHNDVREILLSKLLAGKEKP
ncbi:MAG: DNA repair exonuclease [Desulfobulbaceae bacterium]|nr:DNA repair exonuclease [Desulfobulbaceae bacterium]